MADSRPGIILAWLAAGFLIVMFGMSMTSNGTWMGGVGMGWMMVIPLLLLAAVIYASFAYGRMAERVERRP